MQTNRFTRKRKTKDPCLTCFLRKDLCLCDQIPSLTLKTKISLVIHAKELKRTTNTGRLAMQALTNSEMRLRGEIGKALDLSDLLTDNYRTFLFYPSDEALELTSDLVESSELPIQLIVPDGNWRQAGKIHYGQSELKDIPRVKFGGPNISESHLRKESSEEGMATLQAIAMALGIIEGPEVGALMMQLYNLKLSRTLIGRGQKG